LGSDLLEFNNPLALVFLEILNLFLKVVNIDVIDNNCTEDNLLKTLAKLLRLRGTPEKSIFLNCPDLGFERLDIYFLVRRADSESDCGLSDLLSLLGLFSSGSVGESSLFLRYLFHCLPLRDEVCEVQIG
jgi:hypothetical protein